jgi:hypothetical protein
MSNKNRANENSFVKAQMKNIGRLQNQYNRVEQEIKTMNRLNTQPNKNKRNKLEKMKKNLQKQMINANNSIQRVNEQLKKRNEDKRRKEKELKNYEASIFRGLGQNLIHSNKELAALQAQISNMEISRKMNNASKKYLERMKKRRNTLKKSMSNTTKILKQNKLNTTNIKTIYRDVRNNLKQLLEVLIVALNEKHEAGFLNMKYGGFENQAKKLKKELSKGANNVKDEYTFIGNMTKLFNKIIKFLHKIKPHIEKSLRKDRKGKKKKDQDLASQQIGHAYLNIVEYMKSLKLINKNINNVEIKNLNENVKKKLKRHTEMINLSTKTNQVPLPNQSLNVNHQMNNNNPRRTIKVPLPSHRNRLLRNLKERLKPSNNLQGKILPVNTSRIIPVNTSRIIPLNRPKGTVSNLQRRNNKTAQGQVNRQNQRQRQGQGNNQRRNNGQHNIPRPLPFLANIKKQRRNNKTAQGQVNHQNQNQRQGQGQVNRQKLRKNNKIARTKKKTGQPTIVRQSTNLLSAIRQGKILKKVKTGKKEKKNIPPLPNKNSDQYKRLQRRASMEGRTIEEFWKQQHSNNNNNNNNNNLEWYANGGSRTVHIKGVGKRVVRQTKTGRRYIVVNKKKRYLN